MQTEEKTLLYCQFKFLETFWTIPEGSVSIISSQFHQNGSFLAVATWLESSVLAAKSLAYA